MIKVLSEDAYQTTLANIDLGAIGNTKKASIMWDDGIARKSYVKVYNPDERCRKLCNEMIGYILGKSLNILQPSMAALMPISNFIKPEFQNISDINCGGLVWAWVTSECGDSLKAQFRIKSEPNQEEFEQNNKFIAECVNFLAKKDGLSEIIAFDDLIANNDRNLGNLVITHDGSIGIIDHGEILGRIDWIQNLPLLLNDQYFRNLVLDIVTNFSEFQFQIRGASVLAYGKHKDAFLAVQKEISYWLGILLKLSNKSDAYQMQCLLRVIDYLATRSNKPAEAFAHRIGLVA
ncbi:hypothetical protein ABFY41_11085 [Acinetobacter haemolyticus]|uniref:hypothetical protein n=1 Tax=Acinetobacter haemolyticus TaxID=29430 RepID=UPI003D1C6C7E